MAGSGSVKAVIPLVRGDDGTILPVTVKDTDLAQFSAIRMHVKKANGIVFTRLGVIDDAPNGKLHFDFTADNLSVGDHEAEFEFVRALDSKVFTLPRAATFILSVRQDLA